MTTRKQLLGLYLAVATFVVIWLAAPNAVGADTEPMGSPDVGVCMIGLPGSPCNGDPVNPPEIGPCAIDVPGSPCNGDPMDPPAVELCTPTNPCRGSDLEERTENMLCVIGVYGPCNGDQLFEIDGRIKIRNRSRQDKTMTVLVVIRDPERKRIVREKLTIDMAARSTIRVHPTWLVNDYDPNNTAGKHRYVVREVRDDGTIGKRIKRGAFYLDPIFSLQ